MGQAGGSRYNARLSIGTCGLTQSPFRRQCHDHPTLRTQHPMALIFVINGPNLNLLGSREPKHYGNNTLEDIELRLKSMAQDLGHQLEHIQHNHEGTLIDLIHEAGKHEVDFIIINPAAYTHTSVAIRDALAAVAIPFIEVHLSNIYRREPFRQHSYFSDLALGVISGLGVTGYELALTAAHHYLTQSKQEI